MREQLERMGLRLEGDFTLKSGAQSNIKWDIEKMFQYPGYSRWVRIETLRPWIWEIGLYCPNNLIGIRSGGFLLASDVGEALGIHVTDRRFHAIGHSRRVVVVDDVITTGRTIQLYLTGEVVAIAVLVNRSGLSEINGIPIVSGIYADRV
ncbi:hypothetical protein ES703_117850 [subsurface metagenome]